MIQLGFLLRASDLATEWLIYFMVVFSPWAFGTTQPWSIQIMNGAGYLLGGLLATKCLLRWLRSRRPQDRPVHNDIDQRRSPGRIPRWPTALLAGLTALILGYCLISALNARATLLRAEWRLAYHNYFAWLPHSYDSISTWQSFWNYLALACAFWAIVDWISVGPVEHFEINSPARGDATSRTFLPAHVRRLLWILCVNGALLALEGILQRTSGTGKLLWVIEPRVHKEAATEFGPYAYRSNAAQYFTLLWPLALGFWWLQNRAARFQPRPGSTHHLLLPCVMLMAACPLISLSRAGAIIGLGGIVAAVGILAFARRTHWKEKFGLLLFLAAILFFAWYAGWLDLARRFNEMNREWDPSRVKLWQTTLQIGRAHV